MMRLLLTSVLAASLCAGGAVQTAAPARAAPPSQSGRLCVPMPEMLAFQRAFETDAGALRRLAEDDATIDVTVAGDRYRLSSQRPPLDRSVAMNAVPAARSCAIFPAEETIQKTGSTRAAYVASFEAVMTYRKDHSWPSVGVNDDPSRVDVMSARYGQYLLTMLVDSYSHKDSAGRAELGCVGVEYYRVDLRQGVVLPFDGCIEGHTRVLPGLSQLPQ